jgi:hypothetical protein
VAGTVGLCLATATPASAATVDGTATITNPTTNLPLNSGGSTAQFSVDLPAQAACSGDTATDHYHVFSYLVPKGTTIANITFGGGVPSTGYGLIDGSGYYGSANTAPTTGLIINIPSDFEWADLLNAGATASTLDGGSSAIWEAGIACANSSGTLTDYWNNAVTFTANNADANKFVWTAENVPAPPTQAAEVPGKKSIAVSWVDPTNPGGSPITGYDVYCSTTDPPPTTGTPSAKVTGATVHSATVKIKNGAADYCVVTAVNVNGQSAPSPVPLDNTTTTVTCLPKKGKVATADTCTAKVVDTRAAANTSTGTVAWSGGTGTYGTPTCTLSTGSCTDTFTPSAKGTETLTATYSGDTTHLTSKGTDKLKVT